MSTRTNEKMKMIECDSMHMKQDWLIPVLRTGQGQVFFKGWWHQMQRPAEFDKLFILF